MAFSYPAWAPNRPIYLSREPGCNKTFCAWRIQCGASRHVRNSQLLGSVLAFVNDGPPRAARPVSANPEQRHAGGWRGTKPIACLCLSICESLPDPASAASMTQAAALIRPRPASRQTDGINFEPPGKTFPRLAKGAGGRAPAHRPPATGSSAIWKMSRCDRRVGEWKLASATRA